MMVNRPPWRPSSQLLRRLSTAAKGERVQKLRESLAAEPAQQPILPGVKRKVVVLSGKGGVGKSTLAAQLAFSLSSRGLRVGLLDLDICGPSVPHLLGLRGHRVGQNPEDQKMAPVAAVDAAGARVDAMSIGFLLDSEKEPVVLRGPRKDGVVRQFLGGVSWGELDVLLVDTPPGTSDEHMSLVGALSKTLGPHDGAVVVSTPQAVSLVDVRKELAFCGKQSLRVLGVVENMAPLRTPLHQLQFFDGAGDDVTEATLAALPASLRGVHAAVDVFPSAEGGAEAMAADFGVPFLGRVPLDGAITAASEAGAACASSIALDGVAATLLDALHLDDDAAVGGAPPPSPRPSGGGGGRRAMHTLRRPLSTAVRRRREEHAAAAAGPAAAVELQSEQKLFPTTVHEYRFAPPPGQPLEAYNDALVARAVAGYEQCWRGREAEARAPTGLAGGWRTTANMLYFRQQLAYWREAGGAEHLGALQRAPEFRSLVASMRAAAAAYLGAHGVDDAAAAVEASPLFCWASVHLGGSTHPPHVHSDASVTGTYYARRPAGAAPLSLEDPRGRSPFDLVAGLEHRLRYGDGDGSGGAVPPFDRAVSVAAAPGVCVVFPPWIVHSVPPAPDDGAGAAESALDDERLRVSFSFNLLGKWAHTAATR